MGFRINKGNPAYCYQTQFGYCFRFVFPKDLQRIVSKSELRFSLKTRSRTRATALSRRLAGFTQDLCGHIKDLPGIQGGNDLGLAQNTIQKLIELYFRSVIDGDFQASLKAEGLAERVFNGNWSESGLNSASTQREAYHIEKDQLSSRGRKKPSQADASCGSAAYLRLSGITELYMEEQIRGGNWTKKTEQEYGAALGLLKDVIGDLPVMKIGYQQLQKYKQTLLKLPSHMKTSPKYKGKTIQQLLAMNIDITMSAANVNKLLIRASSLFSYAVNNGYMAINPAHGLQIKQKRRPDELRSIYTQDDLKKLLLSKNYINRTHPHPFCFWMPLLALYTGCRLEELAQLRVDDIKKADNIWFVDINNTGLKKVKTKSAIRIIPLHPIITEDLEFRSFVQSMRSRGEERLFSELPERRDGFGVKVSRWFNERYKVQCGISQNPRERKDFHSFRHTFADHLKQKHVDPYMIAELLGHSVNSVTMGRYGKRFGVKNLFRQAISIIDYEIDLTPLMMSD